MALKYPTVDPETMKHEVIPEAAEFCALERAKHIWSPKEYRRCLSRKIRELIKEKSPY
ncbi:hypothetical protein ES708_34353 [subsurface metagenome]